MRHDHLKLPSFTSPFSYENILQLQHMLKCNAVFTSTVERVSLTFKSRASYI